MDIDIQSLTDFPYKYFIYTKHSKEFENLDYVRQGSFVNRCLIVPSHVEGKLNVQLFS